MSACACLPHLGRKGPGGTSGKVQGQGGPWVPLEWPQGCTVTAGIWGGERGGPGLKAEPVARPVAEAREVVCCARADRLADLPPSAEDKGEPDSSCCRPGLCFRGCPSPRLGGVGGGEGTGQQCVGSSRPLPTWPPRVTQAGVWEELTLRASPPSVESSQWAVGPVPFFPPGIC